MQGPSRARAFKFKASKPLKDRKEPGLGGGQQGVALCPECGCQCTIRLSTYHEHETKGLRILSRHREGGGRVMNSKGDVPCKGSFSLVE